MRLRSSSSAGGAGAGAVAQAFRCALQSRLADQFQLFALLERQLQHPVPGTPAAKASLRLLRCRRNRIRP